MKTEHDLLRAMLLCFATQSVFLQEFFMKMKIPEFPFDKRMKTENKGCLFGKGNMI